MEDTDRPRSQSQLTNGSQNSNSRSGSVLIHVRDSSNHPPPPPPPLPTEQRRSVTQLVSSFEMENQYLPSTSAEEGFQAVLRDINRLISTESYDEVPPHESTMVDDNKSTHVDGQYTDGNITSDADSDVDGHVTQQQTERYSWNADYQTEAMDHAEMTVTELHQDVIQEDDRRPDMRNGSRNSSSSDEEPVEIYSEVKKTTVQSHEQSITVSDENEDEFPPDLPPPLHTTVIQGVNQYEVSPPNFRESSEWQEMAFDEDDDVGNVPNYQNVSNFVTHTTEPKIYQTPQANTTATIVSVNGGVDCRVSFTSGTIDNEGLSPRYTTEGFHGLPRYTTEGIHVKHSTETYHMNTWPLQTQAYDEKDLTLILGQEDEANQAPQFGSYSAVAAVHSSGYNRSGITTTDVNSYHPQTFPGPALIERGIKISDTDTWQRTQDYTSVIAIDTLDNRSMATGSIAGVSAISGTPHGSLMRGGNGMLPVMMVTSKPIGQQNLPLGGYYANGFSTPIHQDDPEVDNGTIENIKPSKKDKKKKDHMPTNDKSIAIELKSKKCRLIVFVVAVLITLAIIFGLIFGLPDGV